MHAALHVIVIILWPLITFAALMVRYKCTFLSPDMLKSNISKVKSFISVSSSSLGYGGIDFV